jgi:hypothetical protein
MNNEENEHPLPPKNYQKTKIIEKTFGIATKFSYLCSDE